MAGSAMVGPRAGRRGRGIGVTLDEVVTEVVLDAGRSHRGRVTVLRLAWRTDDPLAVVLRVSTRPDHPVLPHGDWVVLRDFLRYGLDEPTGDGDVRIRPQQLGRCIRLELIGAGAVGKPCELVVPRGLLVDFLDRTEELVPAGSERSDAALDQLIERLLGSA